MEGCVREVAGQGDNVPFDDLRFTSYFERLATKK